MTPTPLQAKLRRARDELRAARVLKHSGFLRSDPPRQLAQIMRLTRQYGPLGVASIAAAIRHPEARALVDERGALTYADLDNRSNALANAWRERGVKEGDGIAILIRNHRGIFDALFATQKLGARAIFLNTDFAGPQLREVAGREGTKMLLCDEEFAPMLDGLDLPLGSLLAWTDDPANPNGIEALIAAGDPTRPQPPSEHGSFVILTSGTTGTPKGAQRSSSASLTPMGALLGAVPMQAGDTFAIAAPLFHSLGLVNGAAALALGGTVVLRRRFKPDLFLDDLADHHAQIGVLVPIMLQRVLDAYEAGDGRWDLSQLKVLLVAGSQVGAPLAQRTLDLLGDVLYNLYGSTEVAFATIAAPAHLRIDANTVGPPTLGTRIRILDEAGTPQPPGTTGRIFVGNAIPFEGYTGGGGKQIIDGLLSSGDVGHFDSHGLLYIDGRDDAMIVSGGENVFPDEIESLLSGHPEIDEAAAIGVPDETYGQRLCVFVVRTADSNLDADAVKLYVRDNLARFKVPRDVVFMDALPRNPTGKVLKRELRTSV